MKRTASEYDQMKKEIQQEMQLRLAQKEEELKTTQGQNLQEVQQKLEQEKAKLNSEYAQKLQEMENERKRVAAEQQALKDKATQDLAAEKNRLQQKIQVLETSMQQKLVEQKQKEEEQKRLEKAAQEKAEALVQQNASATSLSSFAFGKKEWEKYCGDVGVEPPLPANIYQILQSSCPIWPDKKVADTHLLTLIPETVNDKPLTLNYLEKVISLGGGHATKYLSYYREVKDAIGANPVGAAYWVLLTKDVLPNTRNKNYTDQCQELENWKERSPAFKEGGYRVPKALEVAASVMLEHSRSGVRFYSNDIGANGQVTYTRCQETASRDYHVLVGGFVGTGLHISVNFFVNDTIGLGAAREI